MARSRVLVLAFAASAAIALVLSTTIALADGADTDGDGVPDAIELATQRSVAATSSGDEFNISSRLVSGNLEDQFELSYKAGTFNLWYAQTNGGTSEYTLQLRRLVEWNDTNGNGQIDSGEVTGPNITLGNAAFQNVPAIRSNSTNADGGRIFTFTIPSQSREVVLNLTVAQRFMRIGNDRVLTPMEVKMDVSINHSFAPPRAGAGVGLEMRLTTLGQVQYGNRSWDDLNGFAKNDASMSVTTGSSAGTATVFFGWSESAFANGRQIPAGFTSSQLGPNTYELYLGYPVGLAQANVKIVHDPTFGVESAVYEHIIGTPAPLQGDAILYAGSFAAVAVFVVLTIFLTNRLRKKGE